MCCLERGPPCRQDHLLHDAPRGGGRGGQGQGLYPPRLRNKVSSRTVNKVGSRLSTVNKVGSRLSTVNKVGSRSRTLSPMLQEQGRIKVKDSIPHASGTRKDQGQGLDPLCLRNKVGSRSRTVSP